MRKTIGTILLITGGFLGAAGQTNLWGTAAWTYWLSFLAAIMIGSEGIYLLGWLDKAKSDE